MQWLARVAVDRPVFTWVLSLVLLVLGFASVGSLPVDRFPALGGLQAPPQETWVADSVPLERRGVDWRWLIGLVRGLVDDINAPRAAAIEEASRAESHRVEAEVPSAGPAEEPAEVEAMLPA